MQKEEVLRDSKDEKSMVGEKIEKFNFSFHKKDNYFQENYKIADFDQNKKISTLKLQKAEVLRDKKYKKEVVGGKIEKLKFSFHKNDDNYEEDYKKADRAENKKIKTLKLQKEKILRD